MEDWGSKADIVHHNQHCTHICLDTCIQSTHTYTHTHVPWQSPSSVLSRSSREQGPAATTAPNWDVLKDGYIMKSRAAGSSMLDWEEGEGGSSSLENGLSSDEQENTYI